jgi:hypothetical protein
MEPVAVCVRGDGEWMLVHGDDNPLTLMRLAVQPLAQPPFPLEWLGRL